MTNLEYFTSKRIIDASSLCFLAHICKYNCSCCKKQCSECEFNRDTNLCVQTLLEEHKEPVKLKKWEYDLLHINCSYANVFGDSPAYAAMKSKGYFKGITDTSMTIKQILENCEVVE